MSLPQTAASCGSPEQSKLPLPTRSSHHRIASPPQQQRRLGRTPYAPWRRHLARKRYPLAQPLSRKDSPDRRKSQRTGPLPLRRPMRRTRQTHKSTASDRKKYISAIITASFILLARNSSALTDIPRFIEPPSLQIARRAQLQPTQAQCRPHTAKPELHQHSAYSGNTGSSGNTRARA